MLRPLFRKLLVGSLRLAESEIQNFHVRVQLLLLGSQVLVLGFENFDPLFRLFALDAVRLTVT